MYIVRFIVITPLAFQRTSTWTSLEQVLFNQGACAPIQCSNKRTFVTAHTVARSECLDCVIPYKQSMSRLCWSLQTIGALRASTKVARDASPDEIQASYVAFTKLCRPRP